MNRIIFQEEDRVKMVTEAAKGPLDYITLGLHNLLYEKNHYLKAINSCKDFKSKYPDIELVAKEEFFRDAPGDMKGDPVLRTDSHKLMLKRLHFELYQVPAGVNTALQLLFVLKEEADMYVRSLMPDLSAAILNRGRSCAGRENLWRVRRCDCKNALQLDGNSCAVCHPH